MFIALLLIQCFLGSSSAENIAQSNKTTKSEVKRIVLHSNTDVLSIITNLTGQLASITAEFVAVKQDNAQLKSLVQAVQTNNSHLEALLATARNDITSLQLRASAGATYVRWGRKACAGNGTETVYSGYTAGDIFSNHAAATNHLCLVPDPLWGHFLDTIDSKQKIFGSEYEFVNSRSQAQFSKNLHNEDVPCSVCRPPRGSVLMMPGRNVCYKGWNLEYKGYLMAGSSRDPSPSEYICLDSDPDAVAGGQSDKNGANLFFVEGACGSLKCPPYVNGRELTCVVCSK